MIAAIRSMCDKKAAHPLCNLWSQRSSNHDTDSECRDDAKGKAEKLTTRIRYKPARYKAKESEKM